MTRAVVFGDSWVAAANKPLRPGYARVAPLLLGWWPSHIGAGGTGFVKTSPSGALAYESRLEDLMTSQASIAIIQASGNDADRDLALVDVKAREFLTAVAARFDRVYVLGAMMAGDGVEHLDEMNATVERVATSLGVPFIRARGWVDSSHMGDGLYHPSWRGHVRIARKLARAIRALGRPGVAARGR